MDPLNLKSGSLLRFNCDHNPGAVETTWMLFSLPYSGAYEADEKRVRLVAADTFMILNKEATHIDEELGNVSSRNDSKLVEYKVLYQGTVWYFPLPSRIKREFHKRFEILSETS